MGLKLFSDCCYNPFDTKMVAPVAPNPDPYRFNIIQQEVVKGKSILLVKYDGCTTFGGHKLLLLKRKWKKDMKLDPHLLGNDHIVMARFEPNEQGLTLARICAQNS